ncbi:MAG: DUF4347 domain-containing protein [Gammaproteobacteria bacterium]|nr:DUF4347 domain-containing protein [Gammaproteobacteria bacterium]
MKNRFHSQHDGHSLLHRTAFASAIALALSPVATSHASILALSKPDVFTPETFALAVPMVALPMASIAAPLIVKAPLTVKQPHTGELQILTGGSQIVFIDAAVIDYQTLVNGLAPGAEVYLLDNQHDGVRQMAKILGRYRNVQAVHIIAHGEEASVQLGSVTFDTNTLSNNYQSEMNTIRQALAEDSDLLVHSCNTGRGAAGRNFVEELAMVTGADVAASDDLTGSTAQGADWELEISSGSIETGSPFSAAALRDFSDVLALPADNTIFDFSSFSGSGSNTLTNTYFNVTADDSTGAKPLTIYAASVAYINSATTNVTGAFFNVVADGVDVGTFQLTTVVMGDYSAAANFSGFYIKGYMSGGGTVLSTTKNGTDGVQDTFTFSGADMSNFVGVNLTSFKVFFNEDDASAIPVTDAEFRSFTTTGAAAPAPANTAPTITGTPVSVTVTEDVATDVNLSAVTFADVDGDTLTVTLTANAGTIASAGGNGVFGGVTIASSGTSAMTLAGTAANINTFLDTTTNIKYTSAANDTTSRNIAVKANDATVDSSISNITVNITAIGDTPSVTNASTDEDVQSTSGLVVTRNAADSTEVTDFKITSITGGSLFQNDGSTPITNNAFITFAQANAGLKFTPTANSSSNGSFNIQAGTDGIGGGLSAGSATATITVNAVNDDPSNGGTLPTDVIVTEDVAGNFDISGVTLVDLDAGVSNVLVTLTASAGILAATTGGSVTVGGSGTSTLTLTGTVANIDTFLNTASNIQYTGATDVNGNNAATVAVKINDGGNTGSGGGTDIALGTVNMDITAANDAPTNIALSATSINQSATGAAANVGNLTSTDIDDASFTYTLAASGTAANGLCGAGNDASNANFQITTASFETGGTLTPGSYKACIQTNDGDTTFEKTFTITVNDDAAPTISSVSIPNNAHKVGDTVTATITVASDTEDYTAGGSIAGTVAGYTLGALSKTNNTTYTATFTITDGGADVAAASSVPVNVTLTDNAANSSAAFTTAISQASDAIYANIPDVDLTASTNTLAEDGGTSMLTGTLSGSLNNQWPVDVTVNLAYTGTGTITTDYTGAAAITVTSGNSSGTTLITSLADTLFDAAVAETIIVDIDSLSVGNEGVTNQQTLSITDAETAPTTILSVGNASVAENGGTSTISATLNNATYANVTVNLTYSGSATPGGTDYNTPSSSIIILAGATSGNAVTGITSVDDVLGEGNETIIIDVASVIGGSASENGTQQQTVTITDDEDTTAPIISAVSIANNAHKVGDTVTATITVVSDTEDYTAGGSIAGTIDGYALGALSKINNTTYTATFTITDGGADVAAASSVPVNVTLTDNAANSSAAFTTGISQASDAIYANIPDVNLIASTNTLAEDGGTSTLTGTLSGSLNNQWPVDVTVNLAYTGTGTIATDYTGAASIIVVSGSSSNTTVITSLADTLFDAAVAETIIVDIDSLSVGNEGVTNQQILSITDAETAPTATLSVGNASVAENGGTSTITATLDNATYANVTVNLMYSGTATAAGVDYNTPSASITILAGATSGSVVTGITSVNDILIEGNETIIIDVASVTGGSATENVVQQKTVNIIDDDAPSVSLSVSAAAIAEAAGTSTITATLNKVTFADVTVTLGYTGTATSVTDYTKFNTITILTGQTTGTAVLTAVQDALVEVDETIIVDITGVAGGAAVESGVQQQTVTITDNKAPVNTVLPVISGNGLVGVTLSTNAGTWTDAENNTLSFTYQWKAAAIDIAGATTNSYTVTNAELGAVITAVVTANDGINTAVSVTSNATAAIDSDFDNDGTGDSTDTDDDNDGIPDVWETANGLNPLDASDASGDLDGDGVSNLDEFLASTDPTVDDNPPVITPPADITLDAVGLFTPVDIGVASANDALDGALTPVSDAPSHFSPGINTVTWSATDAAGNTGSATQTVNVNPMADFAKDQLTSEGSTVTFRVILNGDAVSYPVSVPYTVSGIAATDGSDHDLSSGTAIINSGTEVEVSFTTVNDGAGEGSENVVLTMGTPTNAVIGSKFSHNIDIIEGNVAPIISLSADQAAVETLIVTLGNGSVSVISSVFDPNTGDTQGYDWSATDNAID